MEKLLMSNMPNMAWKVQVRSEDMKYRELLNTRRAIDDERRAVDEKVEQLKALAEISMIIAGFTISALCEIYISETVNTTSLSLFGIFTSSTIAVTTICGLITTWLLVGVLKYDTTSKQGNFDIDFWNRLCEKEWQIAFKAFVLGGLFFMLSLIQGSWVLYNDHEYGVVASVIVTVICVSCVVFWYLRVYSKWADTLQKGTSSFRNNDAGGNRVYDIPEVDNYDDNADAAESNDEDDDSSSNCNDDNN